MNKFQKVLRSVIKWITVLWNMITVFLMGVFALVQLSYVRTEDYVSIGWLIGLTVVMNLMNVWISILIGMYRTKK